MIVTKKVKIPYDKDLYAKLKEKQLEAGKVWTDIIKYANQYYRYFGRWISKGDLEKITKNTYNLSAQTVQGIVAKYEQNRKSAKENRKTNKKIKYPWKYKTFLSIPYKEVDIDVNSDGTVVLKNSNYSKSVKLTKLLVIKNKKKPTKKEQSIYTTIPKQKEYIEIPNLLKGLVNVISYGEIVYKKGAYWFHYSVEIKELENHNAFKPAGGDIGEIHSIAVSTEEHAFVISGRAIRSIKQWRSKKLAELAKLMSRCQKGSRQWKKYRRAKFRLKEKSEQQLEYLYHKTTKEVMDFLLNEQVTDFVVGNPGGIEKNTKNNKKKKAKTTKSRRQQLSLWSYGEMKQQLKYKAEKYGIHIHFVNEAYTSQDCPFCGGRHKAKGRRFYCSVTNQNIHRDVNGALNIARKKFSIITKDVFVQHKQPVWYKKHLSETVRQLTKRPTDQSKKVSPCCNGVVGTELALA